MSEQPDTDPNATAATSSGGNGHASTYRGSYKWVCCDVEAGYRAFNAGCDTRLAGKSIWTNPYPWNSALFKRWRDGWVYTHLYWGLDAKWPIKALPKVQGGRHVETDAQTSQETRDHDDPEWRKDHGQGESPVAAATPE